MRLAVFVFSLLLVFTPIYANALLFLPAVKGAIIRTAGSQFVKVNSKRALVTAGVAYNAKIVYDYCKKTKKCDDIIENASEIFGDATDEQNYVCPVYGYMGNPTQSATYYCSSYGGGTLNSKSLVKKGNTAILSVSCKSRDTNIHCTKKDVENKDKELTKEQIQKIVNNMSDDDITYIINNYGHQIDIDKYCSENACDELSDEFGNEVNNNKDKYDIDKINKQNCVVKNGKIVSCDNAKIKQDEETEETTEESTNIDTDIEQKEDDEKSCDGNELYKKMCEFMKWYQNDDEPDDTKIDIKDNDEPLQNKKVDFVGACPAKYEINFTLKMGSFYSQDINIMLLDTPRLCGFLEDWIKPIMLFLGPLHAVYILGRKE